MKSSHACTGSQTPRGPLTARDNAARGVAFRRLRPRRHPEIRTMSRLNSRPACPPSNASLRPRGSPTHGRGHRDSLGLRCRTLFIPFSHAGCPALTEDRLECWLLIAHHLRNVPGRKTDVKDSEWICQLVQHGLVRPSFVPPPEIRRLRDLTRLRRAQTNERGRSIQRLEKVLQDAGIKLSRCVAHLLQVSASNARRVAVRSQQSRAARRAV